MIKNQLKNQIDMALGRKKADLVIKNCQLLNIIYRNALVLLIVFEYAFFHGKI